jgi:hypothetical protein
MHRSSIPEPEALLFDLEVGRFRYSRWRNLSIGVWAGQATLAAVQRVGRISQLMVKDYPHGHSNVAFVLDGVPAPTPEAQGAFSRVFDERNSDLSCTAIVVEGTGFWASSMHSAITGMRLAASGSMRLRLHSTIDEVLKWLPGVHLQRTGVELDPEHMRRVLQTARKLGATGTSAEQAAVATALSLS